MSIVPTFLTRLRPGQVPADGGLCQDLEDLLNTRCPATPADLDGTLPGYGLPDVLDLDPDAPGWLGGVAEAVLRKLVAFEPRLTNVRVTPIGDPVPGRRIALVIEAKVIPVERVSRVALAVILDANGRFRVAPQTE